MKLLLYEWRRPGAIRQQTITWANVDLGLCHHMVSLDHTELSNLIVNHIIRLHWIEA